MKKRGWYCLGAAALVILAAALFWLLRAPGDEGTYDNLIVNGDFEELNDQGLPAHWYTDAYILQGFSTFRMADGQAGKGAKIENLQPNDARFAQSVSVSPGTLYCLHGYIKSEALGGLGANLSIEGVYVFSDMVYDTNGEWTEVSLYGRTGENQHSVTVFARLGGYSGEATGEACFDDVTLTRVDSVPEGYVENVWYTMALSEETTAPGQSTGAVGLGLICLLYGGFFALLCRQFLRKKEALSPKANAEREAWAVAGALLIALTARLLTACFVPGYDVDIGCFRAWAQQMAQVGPGQFYESAAFCDYPPGYLWVLWLLGGLGKLGGGVSEFMVKMPPILADIALCALLYTEAKRHLDRQHALALCLLYAFNPLTFVTGAAWGQTDSVMTLLIFLTVVYALREKWKIALPVYVAAVLVKPQALMFGPLGLAALIVHMLQNRKDEKKRKEKLRDVLLGLLFSVAAGLAIALPFSLNQSGDWLITLYKNTMSQYGYATVNGCNLYFLLGQNWASAENAAAPLAALCAWLTLALPCAAANGRLINMAAARFLHKESAPSLPASGARFQSVGALGICLALGIALVVLSLLGALTYAALGTCMIVACLALIIGLYAANHDIRNLPLLGAALLLLLFGTGSMMHERYLFPAVALLLLAYALQKDRRILWLALCVTLTGLLNVGCVLDRNIRIGGAEGHLSAPLCAIQSDMAILEYLAAAGNWLLSGAALYLGAVLCRADAKIQVFALPPVQKTEAAPLNCRTAPLLKNAPLRKMTGRDWAVMLLCTALYAALAFTNLGSFKAPQNAWVSADPSEQITLDLGEEKNFNMLFYMGIHWYDVEFTIEISPDGERWDHAYAASIMSGDSSDTSRTFECFKWKYVGDQVASSIPALMTGRYVRLTANQAGLTLFEVLFRDAETGEVLPIVSLSDSLPEADCAPLADEQDTLEGEPGWYNSAYFDEIYHARTGYEHLHGLRTYETTHPPLGKVLMSAAIALFGMTPFGWRFAGALAGVLMLPGMYLLGKLLIKRKWGGFGAMMLLALDLMHFTQTRIATIDSFVVLFIIWAVYCMLRWFLIDFFAAKFWKTLIPLGLSGLFMGLSIASKWTGCYAGAGLAVIFFFGIWRRYREVAAARKIPERKRSDREQAAANGLGPLLITVSSCLIFFIAVPLVIYYVSFIPWFAASGGVTVQKVVQASVGSLFENGQAGGMLGYHAQAGLGMDHFFYSPWYQWPIIGKPMWYFSSSYEPAGLQSTIMAMGNPAVWWTGLAGLAGVIFLWARRHFTAELALTLHPDEDDPRFALLLLCFAAQYLPWVMVSRGTYIYHYFPSVPFIILCALLCLDTLSEKREKAAKIALIALLGVAAVLFAAFFPYASGIPVSQEWLDAMKWFPRWLWY